jgi:hypothetical protein
MKMGGMNREAGLARPAVEEQGVTAPRLLRDWIPARPPRMTRRGLAEDRPAGKTRGGAGGSGGADSNPGHRL